MHKNRLPITDMEKMTELTNNNEEFNVYETAWTDTTKAKDVPKDPVDITGGYLIEGGFGGRFLFEVWTVSYSHLRAPEGP